MAHARQEEARAVARQLVDARLVSPERALEVVAELGDAGVMDSALFVGLVLAELVAIAAAAESRMRPGQALN